MSQAPITGQSGPGGPVVGRALYAASGLVRVTVASGTRRVDLVLPGAVPVAELVPELGAQRRAPRRHHGLRRLPPGHRRRS